MLKGDNSPRFWREAYRHPFLLYRGLLSAQSLSHKTALSPFKQWYQSAQPFQVPPEQHPSCPASAP
jgi:hypothetical protein